VSPSDSGPGYERSDQDWSAARERFAAQDAAHRAGDAPAGSAVPGQGLDPGPLVGEFVALAEALFAVPTETGVAGVLERIIHAAQVVVPGAELVSVTLRAADGGFSTPVETSSLATRLDQLQYRCGEGPCLTATAVDGLGVAASSNLAHERQWPRFGPAAAELGVAAVLAVGLFPGGSPPRWGALNLYSFTPGGLDSTDRDVALLLAAHAATALHGARVAAAAELRATQLEYALEARDVIGQAKGILMQRRGCDARAAFDVLRRASQSLNVKLRDVAATFVEHRDQL
jgi:GAF domain-containing protein